MSLTEGVSQELVNKVKAEAMLVCASLLRVGTSGLLPTRINEGSAERIVTAIRALNGDVDVSIWLKVGWNWREFTVCRFQLQALKHWRLNMHFQCHV